MTPALNTANQINIQDFVMELCLNILKTGRNFTGDLIYSAINTTETFRKEKLTYFFTIMDYEKGLLSEVMSVKRREPETSIKIRASIFTF